MMKAWLLGLGLFCGIVPEQEGSAALPSGARSFLERHCYDCHADGPKKGRVALDLLGNDLSKPEVLATWVRVHDKVKAGEMPPAKQPRPEAKELAAFLDGLRKTLEKASLANRAKRGSGAFRRLNREEYENTLRDLLALPALDVKDLLPEDGRAAGFSKVGGALDLSHVQLDKYMEAADLALEMAGAFQPAGSPLKQRLYPSQFPQYGEMLIFGDAIPMKDKKYDFSLGPILGSDPKVRNFKKDDRGNGFGAFEGSVGLFRTEDEGFQGTFEPTRKFQGFKQAGWYKVRVSLWSFWWDKGEVKPSPKTQAALLNVNSTTIGALDAPSIESKVHELTLALKPGDRIKVNVAASLKKAGVSGRKDLIAGFTGPGVAIDWLEVEGPLEAAWPPESHRRLYGDLPLVKIAKKGEIRPPPRRGQVREMWTVQPDEPVVLAERLLIPFLKRAFRRPVPPEEVGRYIAIARGRLDAQVSFEEAMRTAYKAALCSPDFLFLPEAGDDWARASRLSYFLWNSMPDDALFALAEQGKLADATVVRAQAERMLADPKAERFVEDFTDQWLDLREIDATTPDPKLYPEFHPYLRASMIAETRATFREMVRADRPAVEVVRADWAMVNGRLADLYGIPGVEGAAMREVRLPADGRRGGFLTQAAVLKVTANGTVTSPVKRGAWVLDKILNRPPDPPPAEVPAVEPDVSGTTTIREQLAKHRTQPVCATCHVRIDPPGFALESFDVIGGFRDRYRSIGAGDKPPGKSVPWRLGPAVDPAGELADGRKFGEIDAFKRLLASDPDAIARGLLEKFLIYATGAELDFGDRSAVEAVLGRTRSKSHGVRTLVLEAVSSSIFLSK